MRIGFIGAGAIAQAISEAALRSGHEVVLSNSRGPESLTDVVARLGANASAATVAEAASLEVVVLSVPWRSLERAVAGLGPWENRIVIDTNNPIQAPDYIPAQLGNRTSSEVVASLLPGARVVKTLNTWHPETISAPARVGNGRRVQYVSGDDAAAKALVKELLESVGLAVIDLGSLAVGGALQQFPGGALPSLELIML